MSTSTLIGAAAVTVAPAITMLVIHAWLDARARRITHQRHHHAHPATATSPALPRQRHPQNGAPAWHPQPGSTPTGSSTAAPT